eukprot:11181_1
MPTKTNSNNQESTDDTTQSSTDSNQSNRSEQKTNDWLVKAKEALFAHEKSDLRKKVDGYCKAVNESTRDLNLKLNISNQLKLWNMSTFDVDVHCAWINDEKGVGRATARIKAPIASYKAYKAKFKAKIDFKRPKKYGHGLYYQLLNRAMFHAKSQQAFNNSEKQRIYEEVLEYDYITKLISERVTLTGGGNNYILLAASIKAIALKDLLATKLGLNKDNALKRQAYKTRSEEKYNAQFSLLESLISNEEINNQ